MNTFYLQNRTPLFTLLLLTLLWTIFAIYSPQTFLHSRIYTSFMSTIPFTAMLAFALTLIVIAREIDLSFPSIVALGGFVFAATFKATHSPLIAFAAAVIAGLVAGCLNGFLVVMCKIPSIIATIGTQFFLGGLTTVLADGLALSIPEIRDTWFHQLMVGRLFDFIPAQFIWCLVILGVFWLLLSFHVIGDNINFVGDNPKAANLMGVNVNATRFQLFTLMGGMSALTGAFISLEMCSWWPNQGQGYMLLVFASIFIGGTSMLGGRGTLFGTLFGACIIGILEAGIISAGLAGFWTKLVYGVIIILSLITHSFLLIRQQRSLKR
ncbi:MAG: ABC transporter permease [Aliivibrio sp.]|uniref:ABC transporter permease n=1 Tax=Aliivibrio sp. TaxID=1872443 RepID=UPI001A452BA4|nr:ABC transporter permease [Aliivibrio sp.]